MGKIIDRTIEVEGMFCTNCEKRISKGLISLPGMISVDVNYEKGSADISYDEEVLRFETIAQEIEKLGYKISASNSRYIQIASILIILLAVYIIAEHLGWTRIFNIFPSIETSVSLGMLFVIGLLTSIHCIAMCGGINLSQSTVASKNTDNSIIPNIAYNLGRVVSYTVIGGIVGTVGGIISFGGAFRGIVAIAAGLIMIIMSLSMLGIFHPLRKIPLHLPAGIYRKLAGRGYGRSSFVIGLLNGLMPCGPLQSMQIYALSTGTFLMGALSMMIFSLGTVPLMLGFGLLSGKLNRKYAKYMLLVSALLIFIMGLHMTDNGLSLSGVSVSHGILPETGRTAVIMGDKQYVETQVDYGSYEPIRVLYGIPVEWTIYVPEGKLNGCNNEILIPSYNIDVKLSEGYNKIEFTPDEKGDIPYSCWMGMIKSKIEVIEKAQ